MPRQTANKENKENLKANEMDIISTNTPITETVHLPSRGLIPGIPESVIIKPVQRKDKKKILMSEVNNPLLVLLQSCIISPPNFNVYDLLPFDSEYLLFRLRILTYGAEHTFRLTCSNCGHINDVDADFNDIQIEPVPDDFSLTFKLPKLPINGSSITFRLLTEGDLTNIDKKAEELIEATNNKSARIDMLWESRIAAINDQALSPIEISQFLDELTDYDSEYLMEYYSEFSNDYGIQHKLHYKCDQCHQIEEGTLPSVYSFFRPDIKIDRTK